MQHLYAYLEVTFLSIEPDRKMFHKPTNYRFGVRRIYFVSDSANDTCMSRDQMCLLYILRFYFTIFCI